MANGKSIFWKIEKPGLKPSWLLGTMHVSDARVLTMPKGAAEASAAADTIVVESDEILDDKKAAAALFVNPSLTIADRRLDHQPASVSRRQCQAGSGPETARRAARRNLPYAAPG